MVRQDGWCEYGLGKQRNDGGGNAIKDRIEWRALVPYVTDWVSRDHFCLALCSFRPPFRALVIITWRGVGCRYMMGELSQENFLRDAQTDLAQRYLS